MQARHVIRLGFMALCLVATALGLNNTYGDVSELAGLAEKTACGAPGCSVRKIREGRSAFKQTFGFQTTLVQKGKVDARATADVTCRREYVLVGEYRCEVDSGGIPASP